MIIVLVLLAARDWFFHFSYMSLFLFLFIYWIAGGWAWMLAVGRENIRSLGKQEIRAEGNYSFVINISIQSF